MQILPDETFLPFATKLISNARHSIDISTFKAEFIAKPRGRALVKFFGAVTKKAQLGIPVRFLISKCQNYGHIPISNILAVRELKANRVQVRHLRNSRVCHAKIILVDDRYAIIGSHNLSIMSCCSNFEFSIFVDHGLKVLELSMFYTRVFEDAKKA